MFKSQLEPPPESYETTAIFVENIFDTVKKAKAAKAAAAKSVEPSYDYSFGNLSPVKKKKPRKNAKKNAKTKKPTTPKKKLTQLRKPKALKETPDKRKKASPAKSPRKYTKRVPKVPAAADIDDEEAAFILSSISQRSFDSFYSRLNSCETNKIHIPIDISTHSPTKTLSTRNDPVQNLAYYVMLDHNYWIGEPEAPPAVVEPVKTEEIILNDPVKVESEIQIHYKIEHTEPKPSIIDEPRPIANESCEKTSVAHIYDKVNEVNNNKFPIPVDAAPFEQKPIEKESTAVKKRWLRQAATEMKSPPKKRKKENFTAVEILPELLNGNALEPTKIPENTLPVKIEIENEKPHKRKIQEIELKPEEKSLISEPSEVIQTLIEAPVKRAANKAAAATLVTNSIQSSPRTLNETPTNSSIKTPEGSSLNDIQEQVKNEPPVKSPTIDLIESILIQLNKAPENPFNESNVNPLIKSAEQVSSKSSSDQNVKEENEKTIIATPAPFIKSEPEVLKDGTPESLMVSILNKVSPQIETIDAQIEISADTVKEEPKDDIIKKHASPIKTEENNKLALDFKETSPPAIDNDENDEEDERCWESVMDFHRVQLEQLQQKNKRFAVSNLLFEKESTSPEQMTSQLNYDTKQVSSNRMHNPRFSLFENSDYPRKSLRTSLSLETHQYSNSVGAATFQRSTSDISLSDGRKNRWSGTSSVPTTPFISNSALPFNSFYTDGHQFNRDEPYSKTCYSTYRSQKSSWLNKQHPDSIESTWESHKPNNFSTTYSSIKDTVANVFKSEENISLLQKISSTPNILLTKTKTSSCDPRLNPTLVQEVRKEENSAPKKKLSLDQYRKRVSLTSTTSSPPAPEESPIHSSPAFDPAIVADALTG